MSKSIDRVMDALKAANCAALAMEMPAETRTAAQAADAASCDIDQIAKSIIFAGETTGDLYLFITAGGNQVCEAKAAILTGEALGRAHPGFAIGGIPPVGHLSPITSFMDTRLSDFGIVYAAAGTPRHIFGIDPTELLKISNAQISDFTT
jgi:prolyl-tRNA editing enzyme YbaK/EbsC (Cys-tRNA(Pro) deacylase)